MSPLSGGDRVAGWCVAVRIGVGGTGPEHETDDGARSPGNPERDLIEFWNEQYQRAEALRMIGVDAKLFGDQGPLDLITRQIALRVDRVEQGLVNAAAEEAAASVAAEPAEQRSGDEQ